MKKRIVEDFLIEEGFQVSLVGFRYLVEILLFFDPEEKFNYIYARAGKEYGATYSQVERNIRQLKKSTKYHNKTNLEMVSLLNLQIKRLLNDLGVEDENEKINY